MKAIISDVQTDSPSVKLVYTISDEAIMKRVVTILEVAFGYGSRVRACVMNPTPTELELSLIKTEDEENIKNLVDALRKCL